MSWLSLHHEHRSLTEVEIRQALERAAPTLKLGETGNSAGAGALFFARVDQELFAWIRDCHRAGKRILAVGESRELITGQVVWSLLRRERLTFFTGIWIRAHRKLPRVSSAGMRLTRSLNYHWWLTISSARATRGAGPSDSALISGNSAVQPRSLQAKPEQAKNLQLA